MDLVREAMRQRAEGGRMPKITPEIKAWAKSVWANSVLAESVFDNEIRDEEAEACAEIAEKVINHEPLGDIGFDLGWNHACKAVAAAIRQRIEDRAEETQQD